MGVEEYDPVHSQDLDSVSESIDRRHIYCHKCSEDVESRAARFKGRYKFFGRPTAFQISVYLLLLTANLGMIALWWKTKPMVESCVRPLLTYSPAKAHNAVHYERRRLVSEIDSNVYTGPPRPAHDGAWSRLLEPITIKITQEELDQVGEDSIALADGSGYIAEPSIYHELHCIKRVRRHRYLNYYYPNMTELQRYREGLHYDHCLEYWREAAMCRGDTSLATFRWRDDEPVSRVYSERECVNWESLDKWARTKMVNMSDRSILQH